MMSNHFTDKAPVHLPSTHRFFTLTQQLHAYQGSDILPYADGMTDLLTNTAQIQAMQHYQKLLTTVAIPQACVLLAITDEINPKLLLTRRASHLSSHAGEVSLVGGKRDDTDESSAQVALREAYEEVALMPDDAQILGYLPMQISKNGLLVRPIVAALKADVIDKLHPSEDEIERLFWLPLEFFMTTPPTDYVFTRQVGTHTKHLHTPAWVVDIDNDQQPEVIWGLTGRILANYLHITVDIHYPWYFHLRDAN